MKSPPFFLVWNPEGRASTFQHPTHELAQREAERLARACPGQKFYVLQPSSSVVVNDVIIERFTTDEIPF